MKTISTALEQAKPVAAQAADVAKPLVPIAAAVAHAKGGVSGSVAGVVLDMFSEKDEPKQEEYEALLEPEDSQNTINEMTLDEQIEALQKLKSLVDMGILSEEEFGLKKKQIMNL